MKCEVCSHSSLGFEVTVIISFDEIFVVFSERGNLWRFSFRDLIKSANVLSIEFVFLLSVSELDEGFAHFCFFFEKLFN
jgi:hypothetical protein